VQIKIGKETVCEFERYPSLCYLNFIFAIILFSELSDCSNVNKLIFDCLIS